MDDLTGFLSWSLNTLPIIGMIPKHNAIQTYGDVIRILIYKEPPYQIEMFIVLGEKIIPEHTHPNVDSYEVYLGGDINFSHSGKYVLEKNKLEEDVITKFSKARGEVIRVKPNEKHGGVFGKDGGVFLSIQKWLNDIEPHSVAADYTGLVMCKDHYQKVICGKPELKENLFESDVITQN